MNAELFRKLASFGLSVDQIGSVMDLIEERDAIIAAKEDARKAQIRARVHKFRSKNKQETLRNVTETEGNATKRLTRAEDNYLPTEISGQEEKKKAAPKALSDLAAFKADLEQDATSEQVEAFAKHRKTKNGQNSAYSARLFRRDAEACGLSVADAIDTAISRGWLTVKPEYLAGRQARSTSPPLPPPKQSAHNDILDAIIRGDTNVSSGSTPTIDASYDRTDGRSSPSPVRLYAVPSGR